MAHVNVTIAGRAFRMACGAGEEDRLEALAEQVDAKITEMRSAFGEIGDQRLTVMAAITFADDLTEMRKQVETLKSDMAIIRGEQEKIGAQVDAQTFDLARAVEAAAERLEDITQKMNADERRARTSDASDEKP
ncbi:MAG: cell division protein ZapA [Beijerinckiaceae bacterium]|nr:cell division protein ZapA [Beijerinckiaceae bacterium]